jgi:hypothetical protein
MEIKLRFKRLNVLVSGGANKKNILLSPAQNKLSTFITC